MGVTVTDDDPLFPSLVAVIVTLPTAAPLTSPLDETVAMPAELVDHVTGRSVRMFPPASRRVARSWSVEPTWTLAGVGITLTAATGAGGGGGGGGAVVTVTVADPALPPLVAVIAADPTARPITSPPVVTNAMFSSALVQTTLRPEMGCPFRSSNVAVSWMVEFSCTVAVAGVTEMVATPCRTSMVAVSARFCVSTTMRVVPGAIAVTCPVASTTTTLGSIVRQLRSGTVTGVPPASMTPS
jgi:hypothetical protein